MKLAYTMMPGRGDMDLLLAEVADTFVAEAVRVVGVVQINVDCAPDRPCDMDLRLLPGPETLRISQTLGLGAKGCRLDPEALEVAVARTEQSLQGGQLLIVNKFGKHEALGRGFRPVIAAALDLNIPVLCGVNGLNEEAFQDFAGGLAESLPPVRADLERWVRSALS